LASQIGGAAATLFFPHAFHLQLQTTCRFLRQGVGDKDGDDDFPMHCSYLTNPKKTAHGMSTDDSFDYLVSVAKELGVNVNGEKKEYNESKEMAKAESRSYREQDPLNEFVDGPLGKDEGLVKAFPDVFFLGKAYNSNRPSLNEDQTRHLLMQFTANAASCQPLLFTSSINCRGTVP
jgi:hypothetical protein